MMHPQWLSSSVFLQKSVKFVNTSENGKKFLSLIIHREYLYYLYCLCAEYDSQKRSIDVLRTDYPKTYASWLPVLTQLENETSRAELAEDSLHKYWDMMEEPVELEKLRFSMQREAKEYSEEKKDTRPAANVDYEQTVRRTGRKIMPNDPCPCGSGKKYKKCCGR